MTTRRLMGLHPNGVSGLFTFGPRILSVEPGRRASDDYVVPGFIDLQVNGAFSIDVASASATDLREISRRLVSEGTTAWLPTLITAPLDQVERVDRVIAEAMTAQEEARRAARAAGALFAESAILGMHLEGPFVSPHRLGVHPPLNLLPQGEALQRVLRLNTLKLITMAPELDGALDAIRTLVDKEIAVSIGHADASYEQAMAAVAAGARMFTHVFNAMPPLHHRAPGAAGAALSDSRAMAALIADGVHVHPAMLQIAWRARGPGGIIFTSDRVSLAGSTAGNAALFSGRASATVLGGAARRADGTLAGSIITMLDAVRNMRRYSDIDARGIMNAGSYNAARVLRLRDRGNLLPRSRADLLLLNRHMDLKAVFIGGQEIG
ncbi:MAG: N-acetylglucosamine-6-phosphate deacetylase [Deltaproteobacteria bacterium]|nr:N-acetylglucosamine-6-phosphate deacetylase [Deltaproteobacteria bacterium]